MDADAVILFRENEKLKKRIAELETIEREHKRINGELREQIKQLECVVAGIKQCYPPPVLTYEFRKAMIEHWQKNRVWTNMNSYRLMFRFQPIEDEL